MPLTALLDRLRRRVPAAGTAILKGAGEVENVGDVMMRDVAHKVIASLGFTTVHTIGHFDDPADLAAVAADADTIFVLGSLQYSDAWASPTLAERMERSIAFHRQFPNARVVFLPSTWGAFEPQHREVLARLVSDAHVVVRDRFSAESINDALGAAVAAYCPDFAFLYPPSAPEPAQPLLARLFDDPARPLMGIIPNQRCVEPGVTPLREPAEYVRFLAGARDFAVARGYNVVGISHMRNTDRDLRLIRDAGIACVPTDDVAVIRSLIANLSFCICSRYHGLISCLSHGTPVLALGWHHKYRNLMNDMGLGSYHLSVAQLPRDAVPLFDDIRANQACLRRMIARNVATARQQIGTAIDSLPGQG